MGFNIIIELDVIQTAFDMVMEFQLPTYFLCEDRHRISTQTLLLVPMGLSTWCIAAR